MTMILEPPVGVAYPDACGAVRPRYRDGGPRGACVLPLAHPTNVHRDQWGRTWLAQFAPWALTGRPEEVAERLVTLLAGTLQVLDRVARESGAAGAPTMIREVAVAERWRVQDALADMGLTLAEDGDDDDR
jgi:hypothetical protein